MDAIEGQFVHPSRLAARYRAVRNETGLIWTIDVLDDQGECFDSVRFPDDLDINAQASTEAGAHGVILALLAERYAPSA